MRNAAASLLTLLFMLPAPPAEAVLVLDLVGNNLNLSGQVTTDLLGTPGQNVRWTVANSDDSFLMADADALRAAGWADLKNSAGTPLTGLVLLRAGLRVREPGLTFDTIITNGWDIMQVFDYTGDGKVSLSDPAWPWLKLYTDINHDGSVSPGEIQAASNQVISMPTHGTAPYDDPYGTTRSDAAFLASNAQLRIMTDAALGASTTDVPGLPRAGELRIAAAPNPFDSRTVVRLDLPEAARVSIHIHDARGRYVASVFEGFLGPGSQRFDWNGTDLKGAAVESGLYVVRLKAGPRTRVVTVALVR